MRLTGRPVGGLVLTSWIRTEQTSNGLKTRPRECLLSSWYALAKLPRLKYPISISPFAQPQLASHRGRSSLFQGDFDRLHGWMYHLGNPSCNEPGSRGMYFAYDLLAPGEPNRERGDWRLEFAPEFVVGIRELLSILLEASPEGRVVFTTDWQLGPDEPSRFRAVPHVEFWRLHNSGNLRLNSLYPIFAGVDATG